MKKYVDHHPVSLLKFRSSPPIFSPIAPKVPLAVPSDTTSAIIERIRSHVLSDNNFFPSLTGKRLHHIQPVRRRCLTDSRRHEIAAVTDHSEKADHLDGGYGRGFSERQIGKVERSRGSMEYTGRFNRQIDSRSIIKSEFFNPFIIGCFPILFPSCTYMGLHDNAND